MNSLEVKIGQINIDGEKIAQLNDLLSGGAKNVVVLAHYNPDGDAIGSSIAWGEILVQMGHNVTCIVPNKYPYFLDWLEGIDKIKIFKEDKDGEIARHVDQADIIFCLDFNQISRLENLSHTLENNKHAHYVLIDHHLNPPTTFEISFSITDSSSTSFLVYCIIEALGLDAMVTKSIATALYVGIMTDTGNFSFGNLSPQLFNSIATLVGKGIDIGAINSSVYNSFTECRVRLLGYTINQKMKIIEANGNRIAHMGLTESDMRRFSFQVGDSEGFVNYPLTISDVRMSAMFIETKHLIRVSLRSKGDIDVNIFARRYFEGGGHKNASGGKSLRTIEQTIEYFEESVKEYFGGN